MSAQPCSHEQGGQSFKNVRRGQRGLDRVEPITGLSGMLLIWDPLLHTIFRQVSQTLRVTPDMEAMIAHDVWTIEEVLEKIGVLSNHDTSDSVESLRSSRR